MKLCQILLETVRSWIISTLRFQAACSTIGYHGNSWACSHSYSLTIYGCISTNAQKSFWQRNFGREGNLLNQVVMHYATHTVLFKKQLS